MNVSDCDQIKSGLYSQNLLYIVPSVSTCVYDRHVRQHGTAMAVGGIWADVLIEGGSRVVFLPNNRRWESIECSRYFIKTPRDRQCRTVAFWWNLMILQLWTSTCWIFEIINNVSVGRLQMANSIIGSRSRLHHPGSFCTGLNVVYAWNPPWRETS